MFCRVECFISGLSGNFRAVVNAITRLIAFLSSEYISSLVPTLVLFCYCVFLTLKWWRDDDEDEVFPLRRKGFARWHLVSDDIIWLLLLLLLLHLLLPLSEVMGLVASQRQNIARMPLKAIRADYWRENGTFSGGKSHRARNIHTASHRHGGYFTSSL